MEIQVEAIYVDGNLRLLQSVPIPDGTLVEVTITEVKANESAQRSAQLLAEIAALPLETQTDEFSGEDHDKILYGEQGPA